MVMLNLLCLITLNFLQSQVVDEPWEHYFHTPLPTQGLPDLKNSYFQPICALGSQNEEKIFLGTYYGLFSISLNSSNWDKVPHITGPIFDLLRVDETKLYCGAWNGLYEYQDGKFTLIPSTEGIPAVALASLKNTIVLAGPNGVFKWNTTQHNLQRINVKIPRSVRRITVDPHSNIWVTTEMGLIKINDNNNVDHYTHKENIFDENFPSHRELISNNLTSLTYLPRGELWAGGLGGINILKQGQIIRKIPYNKFPSGEITALLFDELRNAVWVGTSNGLVFLRGKEKKVFRSRRWLLSDLVRDLDLYNGKLLISTDKGVSILISEMKTLEEKAEYFETIAQQRHTREPGIVEKCRLRIPGDLNSWEPMDTDNDGGFTSMYLAYLSLKYAVTKDETVKERAKYIFKGIAFLEEVTETPGFIARTVIPSSWKKMADPNKKYTPEEKVYKQAIDPRYKIVEERWRPSRDGKYLWKGDTSSDEITAHFFGLAIYYDFCADHEDKTKVAGLLKRIMDRIIDGGYVLRDIDGEHTRWGVWSPEKLKHDPDWVNEKGINAVEILSFLKTTYHITQDEKYQKEYQKLLIDEDYASLVKNAKNYGASAITHIDDELLSFAYPALFRYETNENWLNLYRESIDHWYKGAQHEKSPMYNFIYAWCTGSDPNLTDSISTLRDIPYDLISWTVDNSNREDVKLTRKPILEKIQTSRLLPPSERGVIRWDKNCWEAIQGDGGRTEWAPTFYLFPYWLGRYLGLIKKP